MAESGIVGRKQESKAKPVTTRQLLKDLQYELGTGVDDPGQFNSASRFGRIVDSRKLDHDDGKVF